MNEHLQPLAFASLTASERFTAMLDNYRQRRTGHMMTADDDAIRHLDESVITALIAMIRLGGIIHPDNVNPPSLIVSTPHLTYGVSVLRQLDGRWSIDS